jgi:hypothetical protein
MGEFKQTFGSKLQVFNGTAKKTVGGLVKSKLKKKDGRIISIKKSKRPMNKFLKEKEKARKNNAESFEYNGNTYYKSKLDTGMVIYSKKKPKSGGTTAHHGHHKKKKGGMSVHHTSHKKKKGGMACGMSPNSGHKKKRGGGGCGAHTRSGGMSLHSSHKKKRGGMSLHSSHKKKRGGMSYHSSHKKKRGGNKTKSHHR